jgi:hypothetical protein
VARESDKPAKDRSRDHGRDPDARLEEALRKLGAAILNEPVPEILYRALGAIDTRPAAVQHNENEQRTSPAMDQDSFRDMLAFAIGFVIESNKPLLRRILKEHVSDDARDMLAKKVLEHLELSGFQIDEERQTMTKRRPSHGHG